MRVVVALGLLAYALADRYHPDEVTGGETKFTNSRNEAQASFWYTEAQDAVQRRLNNIENRGTAHNVIMFLGDGMSVPTLAAARTLLGQRRGDNGEEAQLSFEAFPAVGLSKTYCVNHQIADSACTATAYLCGVKNNYGTLGVTAEVQRGDCAASQDTSTYVDSIAAWALQDGRDAGIVTTTRITHASPAGAYAHTSQRSWESDSDVLLDGRDPNLCPDIAQQLVHHYPGNQFKVILGGGRREFRPNSTRDEENTLGRRSDDRDLIQEWQDDKAAQNESYQYVWNRDQLLEAATESGYLLGLFEGTHMMYHMEANNETEPTLAEMTAAAITRLSQNDQGYFLFVESGRIDHAHHANYVHLALDETIQLSDAVQQAVEMTGDETLIVVTSDHAHVMAFNGYTGRGGDILGLSNSRGTDDVPYLTLSYTNGPGFRSHSSVGVRSDVSTESNFMGLRWRAHVEVPRSSETHGGDDVGVFARGPQQHLFTGVYEQSQIPHLMAYAACIGPGAHACSGAAALSAASLMALLAALALCLLYI